MKDSNQDIEKAVVLLSGGIDSSVCLAIALDRGYTVHALSFDYGQRHRRELESARQVAEALAVERRLIVHFDLREIGGSALTGDMEVPKGQEEKIGAKIPVTYVPARNTIFLSFGLAWAEVLGTGHIFIGANALDYSGYPDCRPEYLTAFEKMANLATKASVEGRMRFSIHAPLLMKTKAEIIRWGSELGLDFSLTWSCYDPRPATDSQGGYVPCGACESCILRARGFRAAGIADPLAHRVKAAGP